MYGVSLCPYIFLENFTRMNNYSQITNIVCFNLCKFSVYLGVGGLHFLFLLGGKLSKKKILIVGF